MKQWTSEELHELRARYSEEKAADIARAMGRTVSAIFGKAYELGLRKSAAFFANPALSGRTDGSRGQSGRIKKGNVPWNKGQSFQPGGRSAETRFKAGISPHNTQPIGSYRVDKDGTLKRKISNDPGSNSKRWRGVHELVWVDANGSVPPKHIVVFKPGMRTNVFEEITLDKVECISLAENMRRNTRHRLPKEINEVIHLRAVLTRQINKRSKPHEQENH